MNLGILGFASPWLLTALLTLPVIWWLLRLVPPAPRRQAFPPMMIIQQIEEPEETPDRSPWWLLLLRLLIAALLILALAGPLINPQMRIGGSGPMTIVLDDDWIAASAFERRLETLEALSEQARRDGRVIRLVRTAPTVDGVFVELMDADGLGEMIAGIEPRPWPADHVMTLDALRARDDADGGIELGSVVWLRSAASIDGEASKALGDYLAAAGDLVVLRDPSEGSLPWLRVPALSALGFDVQLSRALAEEPWQGMLTASGPRGEVLASVEVSLIDGDFETEVALALPRELRNETARLSLEPRLHGAQQVLLDERWRRRTVGLWGGVSDDSQPLLNELYFVRKAVLPYAEIIEGSLLDLIEKPMSLLIMADHGDFSDDELLGLDGWIQNGGVLLRFAGPRLASSGGQLLPVSLRGGERALGGAMSWSEPLRIDSFSPDGPFAGLTPPADILIRRQVLAEPSPELPEATLAVLEDGTPLVTGVERGDGWSILVHTTANANWSNLALSGLFVDVIRRSIEIGPGAGGVTRGLLEPSMVLDARGQLTEPAAVTRPVEARLLDQSQASPNSPPGLYGPIVAVEQADQNLPRKAFNIQHGLTDLEPSPLIEGGGAREFMTGSEIDLGHWLMTAAMLLLLVDLLVAMALRGLLRWPRPQTAATSNLAAMILAIASFATLSVTSAPLNAQTIDEAAAIALTDQTRLGYVRTGIPDIDRVSEAGIFGLIDTLAMRTSIEAGPPVAIDLGVDPIDLFPLIYWPVLADHPDLSDEERRRIAEYLRGGGMVLFDTKDAGVLFPGQDGGGPGEQRLAELLKGMDLAPLEPVPQDHVLTRSFYLLQDFPGRFTGQALWVDRAANNVNDGVSGIIIGAHDWASAWAIDEIGRSLFPVVPGGERQREMARRFGVNLVMYAMTGNYKTDQVHIPALLERLGE